MTRTKIIFLWRIWAAGLLPAFLALAVCAQSQTGHIQPLAAPAPSQAAHASLAAAHAQALPASAQQLLDRTITLHTKAIPLGQALDSIAAQGHFEFSYNSSILPEDSLVKVNLQGQSVRMALDTLLGRGYSYTERNGFLIILRGPPPSAVTDRIYELSGYVKDRKTSLPVANATVYVKEQLISVLTDGQGYFRLRLRVRSPFPVLSVSKEWYADTDWVVHAGYDQVLQMTLTPVVATPLDPVYISSQVERTLLGRWMLSARQRIQSLNLSHFFTSSTSQLSLAPWVGTHGRLSGQVTNIYSLNLIGGYSAGVKGIEVGGVFNIDKKDVHNVQLAGALNLVGGDARGFQCAGVLNFVLGSTTGLQLAGGVNQTMGRVNGVQLSAYSNTCRDTLRGVQVSVLVNKARYMAGVQVGLINFADTSTGVSIGLLSFVKHGGAHQVALSVSPVTGLTAAYRMGSQKLNSIFLVSYNPWSTQRPLFYGYGMGKAFPLGNRWGLYAEVSEQAALGKPLTESGNGNKLSFLGTIWKTTPSLTWRIDKSVRLFVGPSMIIYTLQPKTKTEDKALQLPQQFFFKSLNGRQSNVWYGLTAGISFL